MESPPSPEVVVQTYPANKAGLRASGSSREREDVVSLVTRRPELRSLASVSGLEAWLRILSILQGSESELRLELLVAGGFFEEITEDGHAPQPPEKEAPTRVRRPFGDAAQLAVDSTEYVDSSLRL